MEIWDDVEWLVDIPAKPAESPLWDAARSVLWWVDIMRGHLHRYDPVTREDESVDVGEPIGTVALRASGSMVLGLQSGVYFFDPATNQLELFVAIEADNPRTRANDGKAGPDGAFWMGTMAVDLSPRGGGFYRVDPAGEVRQLLTEVSISNGLDWITEDRLLYIDTLTGGIDVLDVDSSTARVTRRERIIDIPESAGLPDGMCLDAEGSLWVALHGAGEVRRYSADGELVGRVAVPTSKTTSCAFGGPDLTDLYITAAGDDGGHGGLLRCSVGVAGRQPYTFAG